MTGVKKTIKKRLLDTLGACACLPLGFRLRPRGALGPLPVFEKKRLSSSPSRLDPCAPWYFPVWCGLRVLSSALFLAEICPPFRARKNRSNFLRPVPGAAPRTGSRRSVRGRLLLTRFYFCKSKTGCPRASSAVPGLARAVGLPAPAFVLSLLRKQNGAPPRFAHVPVLARRRSDDTMASS